MKRFFIAFVLMLAVSTLHVQAQSATGDYSGLLKTAVTMTNAQVDSTVVSIGGSRSAITFNVQLTKVSGTSAGSIVLMYKTTNLASEQWITHTTTALTDQSGTKAYTFELGRNVGVKYKLLLTTSGTSVNTYRPFLVYRK
jgi:hypothetical protein